MKLIQTGPKHVNEKCVGRDAIRSNGGVFSQLPKRVLNATVFLLR